MADFSCRYINLMKNVHNMIHKMKKPNKQFSFQKYYTIFYIFIYKYLQQKILNLFSFNHMQQTSQVFDSIFVTKKEN